MIRTNRYPPDSIRTAHPLLADLENNAVYHLLMRPKIARLVLLDQVVVPVAFVLPFALISIAPLIIPPGLGGFIGFLNGMPAWFSYILLAIYFRFNRTRSLARFLGVSLAEAEQYALIPVTVHDVMAANWGRTIVSSPPQRMAAICFGVAGVLFWLMIFGWLPPLSGGVMLPTSVMAGAYWLGIRRQWHWRALDLARGLAWRVKAGLTNEHVQSEAGVRKPGIIIYGLGGIAFIVWVFLLLSAEMAELRFSLFTTQDIVFTLGTVFTAAAIGLMIGYFAGSVAEGDAEKSLQEFQSLTAEILAEIARLTDAPRSPAQLT